MPPAYLTLIGDLLALRREVAIATSVNHHRICAWVDLFWDAHSVTFVQELALGGDLFDRVRERTCYTESAAAAVMARLLQALAYLHRRGIMHRDSESDACSHV